MLLDRNGHFLALADLAPGDILLTLFDPLMPVSYPIAWATRSKYIHTTIYVGHGLEWSINWNGSVIRSVGTDRLQHVFRPKNYQAAKKAAEFVRSPDGKVVEYNLDGAIWQGIQVLGGVQQRSPLPWTTKAKFCSEGTTDVYAYQADYDLVPWLENGTSLPRDLADPRCRAYQL